jgi:hypothetical protein
MLATYLTLKVKADPSYWVVSITSLLLAIKLSELELTIEMAVFVKATAVSADVTKENASPPVLTQVASSMFLNRSPIGISIEVAQEAPV